METPETWIATYEKMPSQIPEIKEFYKPVILKKSRDTLQPELNISTMTFEI
jgi:hypothetical protein